MFRLLTIAIVATALVGLSACAKKECAAPVKSASTGYAK